MSSRVYSRGISGSQEASLATRDSSRITAQNDIAFHTSRVQRGCSGLGMTAWVFWSSCVAVFCPQEYRRLPFDKVAWRLCPRLPGLCRRPCEFTFDLPTRVTGHRTGDVVGFPFGLLDLSRDDVFTTSGLCVRDVLTRANRRCTVIFTSILDIQHLNRDKVLQEAVDRMPKRNRRTACWSGRVFYDRGHMNGMAVNSLFPEINSAAVP